MVSKPQELKEETQEKIWWIDRRRRNISYQTKRKPRKRAICHHRN
jgi:hypothetical protein